MNKLLAIIVAAFFTVVSIAPVTAVAEEGPGDKASAADQASAGDKAAAADPAVADKEAANEKTPTDAPASGDQ